MPFQIVGLSDTGSTLLHETPSLPEARRWAAGYARDGFGGHEALAIVDMRPIYPNGPAQPRTVDTVEPEDRA